ncbi:hypothetical protein [Paludisphaera rhizosphaerae]|uniref:hypothetical protein n=1 Tax=Paludisphaera rhizosphaerae TaxID=2711216 RepID=UPI0013EBB8C5|nr:hypothetical protein [Paludisphaera rhizosphaerae]
MIGRLRLSVPWSIFGTLLLAFAISETLIRILGLAVVDPRVHRISLGALYSAAALFGVFRACNFHPYFRPGYRAWLATTPWTVDKPLPLGPIELDWPDAVVLGALILSDGLLPEHESVRLLAVFLFFHGLFLTLSIYRAADHVPAFMALFGLGLMVRLWPHPWACAATGVIVYLIVYDGLRISLRSFPWTAEGEPGAASQRGTFDPDRASCGWPYDRLLREPDRAPHSPRPAPEPPLRAAGLATPMEQMPWHKLVGGNLDYLLWSLLVGWWISCVGPLLTNDNRYAVFLLSAMGFILLPALAIRLSLYTNGYAPPLSLVGRLFTGRWIVPGYDVVFVGPFLILAVPGVVYAVCVRQGVPWRIAGPVALSSMLFVALATPPGLRRWRLVGRHRMIPGPPRPGVED